MNDQQKYKLIIWHAFLEDMNKVKDKMKICFPGYEVQYGEMANYFDWHIKNRKKTRKTLSMAYPSKEQKARDINVVLCLFTRF